VARTFNSIVIKLNIVEKVVGYFNILNNKNTMDYDLLITNESPCKDCRAPIVSKTLDFDPDI
jgi:hypothetical protein